MSANLSLLPAVDVERRRYERASRRVRLEARTMIVSREAELRFKWALADYVAAVRVAAPAELNDQDAALARLLP